jgi:hypothetical protein
MFSQGGSIWCSVCNLPSAPLLQVAYVFKLPGAFSFSHQQNKNEFLPTLGAYPLYLRDSMLSHTALTISGGGLKLPKTVGSPESQNFVLEKYNEFFCAWSERVIAIN